MEAIHRESNGVKSRHLNCALQGFLWSSSMPKDQIMEAIYRESNGVNSRLALLLCFAVFGISRVFSAGTACQVVNLNMKRHQRGMLVGKT